MGDNRKAPLIGRVKEFFSEEKNRRRVYSVPELCHRFHAAHASLNTALVEMRREGWRIEGYNEFGVKYYTFQIPVCLPVKTQEREALKC